MFTLSFVCFHEAEAHSEPSQISKMELPTKIVNFDWKHFAKSLIIGLWLCFEYASVKGTYGAISTAWKVSKCGVISGPYFSLFGPEITPYLDTFHSVIHSLLCTYDPNFFDIRALSFYVNKLPYFNIHGWGFLVFIVGTVLSHFFRIQFNSEEHWTKALKFMLTNLKWGLAWVSSQFTDKSILQWCQSIDVSDTIDLIKLVIINERLDRDHSFITYIIFSEKLTFLTPWYAHTRINIYQVI